MQAQPPAATTGIDAAVCERLVAAAAASRPTCAAPAQPPPAATTADAIAGLAVSLNYATLGLGILSLLALIGWLIYVRHRAREAAKAEVEKVVPAEVRAYLDEKLAGIVAEVIPPLLPRHEQPNAEEQAQQLREDAR